MQPFKTVLFDLDGTLTDPGEGITNSVRYALNKMGIREPDTQKLYRFIGPPLKDSFMEFYGMDEAQAMRAIAEYRVYYGDRGIRQNRLIPGMKETLSALRSRGKKLLVATSKPEHFSYDVLKSFDLLRFFDGVYGADDNESRVSKGDVLRYAIANAAFDTASAVMVGDRKFDVLGAKEVGIPTVGVLFGYGTKEELLAAGAISLISRPEELLSLIG